MLTRIRKIVAAPVFEDEERTRVAGLLNTILLVLAAVTLVVVPYLAMIDPATAVFNLPIGAVMLVIVLGLEFIMRRGYLRTASMLLASSLLVVVTATIYVFGGIRNNAASAYVLVVAIAALLLSGGAAVMFGLLSMLAALGVFYAEISGAIVIPMSVSVDFVHWLLLSAVLGMGTLLLHYAVRSITAGFEQARQEIAERKQAEEALRVSEERFALAMQGSNDGLYDWDIVNNTLYWSPRLKEILGYADDELDVDFDTFETLLHPDDREHTNAAIESHLKNRELFDVEQRLLAKSGKYVWARARGQAVWDENGQPIRMVGSTTDITERKRAETDIRRLNQFLDSVINTANVWLDVIDKKGNVMLRNRAAEEISGYSREEVLGHAKIWEWLYPDEKYRNEILARAIARIETGEEAKHVETIIRRKDGQTRVISWNSRNLVDEEGNSIGSIALGHDITERKRTEEALAEERNLLRTIIDNLPDSIYVKDTESRYSISNAAHVHFLGATTPDEVVGKSVFELFPQELAEQYYADDQKVIQSGQPLLEREERSVDPTGNDVWNLTTKVPLRDSYGKIVGIVGIARDITERKRAEEALRESREALLKTFESITDGISVIDLNGVITEVNQGTIEMHGFSSKDELLGRSAFELVAPRDHEKIAKNIQQAIKQGALRGIEYTLLRADGSEFPGELSTSVLKDASGNLVGHVTIARDITERKRAQEELWQLKEFNEGIVQGMEEGIIMEDAEGHITFVNPKMAEMLGYTEQELTEKHWSEIIAPSCLSQVEEESSKRPKGISTQYEAMLLRKDKREVPGLISARPLFREGEFAGTLAVCTDLTERKEMEQQLLQSEKLAAIGQLVAGVAHELNNPLTSVAGYSHLLLKAECSEEIKRDLDRINRQALRAAKIVENLLTFARRREPRKESINLNEVVERSLELQAHQLELDHISIVKELDEALPPTLADPFQMQQVFMNIIGNAYHALRDWDGERQLRVRSELAGDMIHLEFADSGPGIPPEVMGRLFEPFFTTREVGEGTGLGLSISYGIVEAHGGKIWAKSEVGKGATLIVEIPMNQSAQWRL